MSQDRNFEGGRFRSFRKRILGEEEGRSLFGDAKDVMGGILNSSEKVRGELFRAIAREIRAYLEESGLKDDVHNLLTNYAAEVHLSVNLRKLSEKEKLPRGRRAREAAAAAAAKVAGLKAAAAGAAPDADPDDVDDVDDVAES
jgi:hypothetical protein